MLNLVLFLVGNALSSLGFGVISFFVASVVYYSTGVYSAALVFLLEDTATALFTQISGIIVDKFGTKFVFFFADLVQAVYLLSVFIYVRNSDFNSYVYLTLVFISLAIKSFEYSAKKAILPLLFEGDILSRANSFEIFTGKVAKFFALLMFLTFFKAILEVLVLIASILFFISAIAKSYIIVPELETEKESTFSTISGGFESIFKRKIMILGLISNILINLFCISFFIIVIPALIKLHNVDYLKELSDWLDAFAKANLFNANVNLRKSVWPTFVYLFVCISPIFISLFFQMIEKVLDKPVPKILKRFMKYVYTPAACLYSFHLLYYEFFNKDNIFATGLLCFKDESIYDSVISFISMTGIVGNTFAMLFFQIFPWKYRALKGIKLSTYSLVPISFLIASVVTYFGVLGKGDMMQLIFCLIPLTTLLHFASNAQFVYFTNLYQSIIPYTRLGRVSSALVTFYILFGFIGEKMYAFLTSRNMFVFSAILFVFGSILNAAIAKWLEKEAER